MSFTESHRQEIIAFTRELVQCPGGSGHEAGVAGIVRKKMDALGYKPVTVDEFGSVIGVLSSGKPGPTLLFDGHMDVVPVGDPTNWEHDPFKAELSQGRIWGRGTADMKGALAAMVCGPAFLKRSEFCGNILVSASVAEERLIGAALSKILETHQVDAVIIGEPTKLKIGIAEKGRAGIEIVCHGTVAHSSRPDLGDNAVYRMFEVVEQIRSMPRRNHALLGNEVIELVEISSRPFPGSGSIPGECRSLWECRLLHGESRDSFLTRWNAALANVERTDIRIADYELEAYTGAKMGLEDFLPGWISDFDKGLASLVAKAVEQCGRTSERYAAPYGCNALVSAARGIPTVILGPGDIELAHKPDENILVADLLDAARIYATIGQQLTPKS